MTAQPRQRKKGTMGPRPRPQTGVIPACRPSNHSRHLKGRFENRPGKPGGCHEKRTQLKTPAPAPHSVRGSPAFPPTPFTGKEPNMVKVLMERTIRGQNVGQIVRLLRQLRVLAMQQPGYISGETLHGVDDPNYYLVISTWESLKQWQNWFNNPERRQLSTEIDGFLASPTVTRVMTN
jgi:heme-degrading monooxygenase HmoA